MNQSIGKIASLFVAVVFISGCAGTASPVEEAQKALNLGNNAAAEQLFKQALATGTTNTAEAAYQLGNLDLQGMNYEGAERYYQQAVDLKPDNLLYLDAAGFVARERGQYAKAASFCQRALVLREKTLGSDHLDVAKSLNNLALVYYAQGQQEKAEPLYQRKLAILEKIYGPEHSEVTRNVKNLEALQTPFKAYSSDSGAATKTSNSEGWSFYFGG